MLVQVPWDPSLPPTQRTTNPVSTRATITTIPRAHSSLESVRVEGGS